jgi:pimeloyl-ACP methyl ester carboxylesterase
VHCIAHSWGGVLLLASLRRFPDLIHCVRTITLFGTKRTIRVRSFSKFVNIDLLWNIWGRVVVAWHGYLPKG